MGRPPKTIRASAFGGRDGRDLIISEEQWSALEDSINHTWPPELRVDVQAVLQRFINAQAYTEGRILAKDAHARLLKIMGALVKVDKAMFWRSGDDNTDRFVRVTLAAKVGIKSEVVSRALRAGAVMTKRLIAAAAECVEETAARADVGDGRELTDGLTPRSWVICRLGRLLDDNGIKPAATNNGSRTRFMSFLFALAPIVPELGIPINDKGEICLSNEGLASRIDSANEEADKVAADALRGARRAEWVDGEDGGEA